jgi:hypothetical protein
VRVHVHQPEHVSNPIDGRIGVVTDVMSERYGAPSRRRQRAVVIGSAVLGVVALAWLAWAVWFQSTPQVQSKLQTFAVLDAHEVSATVYVRLGSDDVKASCLLRAYAEDHAVVGELDFSVTGRAGTRTVERDFRTERGATTVDLVGCTTPDQERPR